MLVFVGVFLLGFTVVTWSGMAERLARVDWYSFQRLWTRAPESLISSARWLAFSRSRTTTAQAPEVASAEKTYTARAGDTLSRIAARHGMELSELVALNGIEDPDQLRVGQMLLIPGATRSAPESSPPPASDPERESERLMAVAEEDREANAVGRFESFSTALHQVVRTLGLDGLFRRPENSTVAPEPSTATVLPAEAPAPTTPPPASDFRALDELLAMGEMELQGARFEDALETAEKALRLLESEPDSAEARQRRVRLELVRANVHTAFGSSSEARRSIERALRADPDLVLDATRTSPRLLRAFHAAGLLRPLPPDRSGPR